MYEPTFRPIISVIRVTPDESVVEVTLDRSGQIARGFGDIAGGNIVTAAAVATCTAVGRLLPDSGAVSVRWAERFERKDDEGEVTAVITCAVDFTARGGEIAEVLIGSAMIHHDHAVAAVRATLDGLTRRLAPGIIC